MGNTVKLIGLDFGTTTSSCIIANATLTRSLVTGRMQLDQVTECYRSDTVFTPMRNGSIDEQKIEKYLDSWLARLSITDIFSGGALLTGLTAQKSNADKLVRLVRQRLGDALIATADDPCLESWLAFMAACGRLSRDHPDTPFVNLDVGGGTTNIAVGKNGQVVKTGCIFIGGRHVEVVPGGYQIENLSRYGKALLDSLGIRKRRGDCLTESERDAILSFYLTMLEATTCGPAKGFQNDALARFHTQVDFHMPVELSDAVVTFSGGVGELVYRDVQGLPLPGTTHYGDLGIDLAKRIVLSGVWSDDLRNYIPTTGGRATVYGLLRHSSEISGTTLFLACPETLPLREVPILGTVSSNSTESQIHDVLNLVRRSSQGGCLQVTLQKGDSREVRDLGMRLSHVLKSQSFPDRHPLVFLVRENLGKILGHYVTQWGALPINLLVIDEIPERTAQYVHIGSLHGQVLPVSFYGLQA